MGTGGPLAQAKDAARRGMPPLKITDVKIIATAPSGSNWTIVKVETSEPGLYGLGAATHQEIPQAAQAYIEKRLKPFVIGKNCDDIEDIWQSAYLQEYFRSGPEGNDALSGIDGALWDILGKRLGVPVYQLLGGKVRAAVPLYGHAAALDSKRAQRPGPGLHRERLPGRAGPVGGSRMVRLWRRRRKNLSRGPGSAAGRRHPIAGL